MAIIELLRLPTEDEIAINGIERDTFLEAFENACTTGFKAEVKDLGDLILIDGEYEIQKADWFVVTP